MTYLEKQKQMHPEWSQKDIDRLIKHRCPHIGDSMKIAHPNFCTGYDYGDCTKCWNREIPETEPVTEIKDSGNRTEFESGAVRDIQEGKGRCDLLPLDVVASYLSQNGISDQVLAVIGLFQKHNDTKFLYTALELFNESRWKEDRTMILEVSKHFEEGAKKYGEHNWQKGIPVRCYINSAVRHYLKWLRGDKDEPHDRAFCWNILCAIWTCKHKPEFNDYRKEDNNA